MTVDSDGSLTITGNATADAIDYSINTAHDNTWSGMQRFDEAATIYAPTPPTSGNVNFSLNINGFQATGITYNYYIYAYYFDGVSFAYDATGFFISSTDPNDSSFYEIDLSWAGATDANGYFVYDFNASQYFDAGNVTSVSIIASTSWTSGFPPSSPTSITVSGVSAWFQSGGDYSTEDFTAFNLGGSSGSNLQAKWYYAGAGGNGALRFEDTSGTLRFLNANLFAENINVSNQATVGIVEATTVNTTNLSATAIATKQILHSNSGSILGDAGFEWDRTNNRLLVASASLTAQSKIHVDAGTGVGSEIRFTAGSTTGQTSSDGFTFGITSAGVGQIYQRESQAIELYTSGTLRASWAATISPRYTVFGGIEAQYNALATTSTDGLLVSNTTSATVGATIQRPGRIRQSGHVWDTGAAATRVMDWIIDPIFTSGNPGSSVYGFGYQYNSGGYTYLMNLSSTGRLMIGNGSTVGSANLHVYSTAAEVARFQRSTASNAAVGFVNSTSSCFVGATSAGNLFGVASTSDIGTDGKLFVNTANAAMYTTTASAMWSMGSSSRILGISKLNVYGTSNSTDSPLIGLKHTDDTTTGKNGGLATQTRMTSRYLQTILNMGFNDNSFGAPGVIQWTAWEYTNNTYSTLAAPTEFTGWNYQYYNGTSYQSIFRIHTAGVYIGASSPAAVPSAKLHVVSTTEQQRLGYDTSNYIKTTVSSTGVASIEPVGTDASVKLVPSASKKFSLWNATPIVQPTTAVAAATFVTNTSLIANDTATFDGYTIGQVVKALRNIGVLA